MEKRLNCFDALTRDDEWNEWNLTFSQEWVFSKPVRHINKILIAEATISSISFILMIAFMQH